MIRSLDRFPALSNRKRCRERKVKAFASNKRHYCVNTENQGLWWITEGSPMQLMVLGAQTHKLERQLSAHQPGCSSPGQKVTEPISWGHAWECLTVCRNHQNLGKPLWLLEQLMSVLSKGTQVC